VASSELSTIEMSSSPRTPSREADTLSALIAAIYDAAIDPTVWSGVLRAVSVYVGGHASAIYAKSISGMAFGVFHDDGVMSEDYKVKYFETYAKLDPATAGHLYAELEQPISTADILDVDEFRQSRFYREWAVPQGIVDFLSAPIEKQGQWAAMFGVFRSAEQGMVDDAMRHRMRHLVPHVRRAVLIGKVIEDGSRQAASFSEALDGLASGLFLVDGQGRIVHANEAADRLVTEATAVAIRNGRLVALERTAGAALAESLAAAAIGDAGIGLKGISVPIETRDGGHYVAHVLPLTSGARRNTGAHYAATAAVFVHATTLHVPAAPELVAKAFGLTLSELRVLLTITQVGGVGETAATLGLGEATVKTHLHRVFAKTGTSRQADLVKLIAGFAGPLSQ
jgi:DNA-binding CsgD family transcriptional regulator/PAS domain-containing protein